MLFPANLVASTKKWMIGKCNLLKRWEADVQCCKLSDRCSVAWLWRVVVIYYHAREQYLTAGAMQSDISELERTRESMARELVSVCIQNEDLTEKLSYHESLRQQYAVSWHLRLFFVLASSHDNDEF